MTTYRLGWGLLLALLLLGSCKMAWRSLRYNVPSVTDHRLFAERPIRRAGPVSEFTEAQDTLPPPSDWALGKWYKTGMSPEDYLEKTGTVAFLILRDDSLVYERYWDGFNRESRFNSFSMSKAYISALTGIALEEGYLDSLDQSIGDYLEYCRDSALCRITIRQLLQMTSGLRSSEGYLNPWATSTKLYYGDQLEDILHRLKLKHPPGTKFSYSNLSYQLLGMVVARATERPLAQYLEEKIWQPLGMESDAGWSLHEGTDIEKGFCCLNVRARDFARFGRMLLNRGMQDSVQVIPRDWLRQSFALDTAQGSNQRYQFGWYVSAEQEDFYAEGLLGQYIYVAPSTRTVIVRLGNSLDYNVPWYTIFKYLSGLKQKPKFISPPKKAMQPLAGQYTFGVSNFGDTSLVGKVTRVRARRKGLEIKSEFGKKWKALPESDSVFYNLKYGRELRFRRDKDGRVIGMRWERRGNFWELGRNQGPGARN